MYNREIPLAFVGTFWILLFGGILWWDYASLPGPASAKTDFSLAGEGGANQDEPEMITPSDRNEDPAAFTAPYENYVVTQGPHGFSYGHMAVDISGGKDATILSPIAGEVTAFYVDQIGNTTLVIENQVYTVTLLHGLYHVDLGENLQQGQPIGSESNQGYTLDFQGNPCWGRDCGYHTHLNVFDKRTGQNIDPLTLFQ
jgi:murein DD-endopeptidase MepM/ murein hydrolase activator NlpD